MKKIFLILAIFTNVFAQTATQWPSIELMMRQYNPNNTNITHKLESVSDLFDYDSYTSTFFLSTDPSLISSTVTIQGTDLSNNNGWDMVTSRTNGNVVCGIGLYKLSNSMTNAFIYLDFRECGFAKGSQEKIDTWFKYDAEKKKYYWNDLLRNNQWVQIYTGDIIRIWEIKNTVPKTDCLPNFWRNNLSILHSEGNKPLLVWAQYPTFSNISGYYIYSGTPTNGIAPNDNDYQQIQQTGSTVYDYVDNSVGGINEIGGTPYIRLYFVKAKQGTQYSERSNIEIVFSNVNWSNALVMVNEKNNPSLMWDEYKGFDAANISGYKIYRGMPSQIKPSLFIFNSIATVTKDEIQFIDHDIFLSSSSGEVRYYVKAILSQGESSATNTVSANGGLYKNSPPPRSITQRMNLV